MLTLIVFSPLNEQDDLGMTLRCRELHNLVNVVDPNGHRFLEGDTVVYSCDGNQRGQLVWLAITTGFFRIMDCASHTVCFELVPLEEISAVVESSIDNGIAVIKKGTNTPDILAYISVSIDKNKLLSGILFATKTYAASSTPLTTVSGEVSVFVRTKFDEAPIFVPLPSTGSDRLRLASNPSVKNKLIQHGDTAILFTDRVYPEDQENTQKVIIVSDTALYVTDKVGKVEFRSPLSEILSISLFSDDPTLLRLDFEIRSQFQFKSRHASALVNEVLVLVPTVCIQKLTTSTRGPSPASESSTRPGSTKVHSPTGSEIQRNNSLPQGNIDELEQYSSPHELTSKSPGSVGEVINNDAPNHSSSPTTATTTNREPSISTAVSESHRASPVVYVNQPVESFPPKVSNMMISELDTRSNHISQSVSPLSQYQSGDVQREPIPEHDNRGSPTARFPTNSSTAISSVRRESATTPSSNTTIAVTMNTDIALQSTVQKPSIVRQRSTSIDAATQPGLSPRSEFRELDSINKALTYDDLRTSNEQQQHQHQHQHQQQQPTVSVKAAEHNMAEQIVLEMKKMRIGKPSTAAAALLSPDTDNVLNQLGKWTSPTPSPVHISAYDSRQIIPPIPTSPWSPASTENGNTPFTIVKRPSVVVNPVVDVVQTSQYQHLLGELAEANAKLTAYQEANETLKSAILSSGSPQRDLTSMTHPETPGDESEMQSMRLLISLRDAEISDLKSTINIQTNPPTTSISKRQQPSHKHRPSKLEAQLQTKTVLAEAAFAYFVSNEKRYKTVVEENKDLERRVAVVDALQADLDSDKKNEKDFTELRKRLALKEYELLEATKRRSEGDAELQKMLKRLRDTKEESETLLKQLSEKVKQKIEILAYDISSTKSELQEANETITRLKNAAERTKQDNDQAWSERENDLLHRESLASQLHNEALARMEERTQRHERSLSRQQAALIQELHQKQGTASTTTSTPKHQTLDDVQTQHLAAELRVANLQLEAFCIEQAKSAFVDLSPSSLKSPISEQEATVAKFMAKIGELQDKVVARDDIIKELKSEMSRLMPMCASDVPNIAPGIALRKVTELQKEISEINELYRTSEITIDAREYDIELLKNGIQKLTDDLDKEKRHRESDRLRSQFEISESLKQAMEARVTLEAKETSVEIRAHIMSEVGKKNIKKTTTDDQLRLELISSKAELLTITEQLNKECSISKTVQKQKKSFSKQMQGVRSQIDKKTKDAELLEEECIRLRERCSELKAENNQYSETVTDNEAEIATLNTRLTDTRSELSLANNNNNPEKETLNNLTIKLEQASETISSLEEQVIRATSQFNDLNNHMMNEQHVHKEELSECISRISSLQSENDTLKDRMKTVSPTSVKQSIDKALEEMSSRSPPPVEVHSNQPMHKMDEVTNVLKQNGHLDDSRVTRCVDRLYTVLKPATQQQRLPQQGRPPTTSTPPVNSYASRHLSQSARSRNRMAKTENILPVNDIVRTPPTAPPPILSQSSVPSATSRYSDGDRHREKDNREGRDMKIVPAVTPPASRSNETAALYAKLGLSELAPFAAT